MAANYLIRWMIRRDIREVLEIETGSFPDPWGENDFLTALSARSTIGMVTEDPAGKVVGFMLYELDRTCLGVLNFAVHPQCRGKGVGKAMVARLKEKLSQNHRRRILFDVGDHNLAAHLFLKSQGFTAYQVLREHFENGADCYRFEFNILSQGSSHVGSSE